MLSSFLRPVTRVARLSMSVAKLSSTVSMPVASRVFASSAPRLTSSCRFKNTSSPFQVQSDSGKQNAKSPSSKDEGKQLIQYEKVSNETLESLTEKFEELGDMIESKDYDVSFSNGVLTVKLGQLKSIKSGQMTDGGTYVINKQTPNLQIWLSSPISGPKRFDLVDGTWVYKHTRETLHGLLQSEFENYFPRDMLDLSTCSFSSPKA